MTAATAASPQWSTGSVAVDGQESRDRGQLGDCAGDARILSPATKRKASQSWIGSE